MNLNDSNSGSNPDSTGSYDLLKELTAAPGERFTCRVATPQDSVYHHECCYTFHTPYTSDQGIVVNLNTFIGTIESMAMIQQESDSVAIFLRIVKEYVARKKDTTTADGAHDDEMLKPTKLAIGVKGGFQLDEDLYTTVTKYSVVVLQQGTPQTTKVLAEIPYPIETDRTSVVPLLPSMVQQSVHSIIHHVGAAIQTDIQAWNADAQEEIPISKYCTNLPYVDNGVEIDPHPSSWCCQATNRPNDDNLWLNLSDGYIGGGRKHWDVRTYVCVCAWFCGRLGVASVCVCVCSAPTTWSLIIFTVICYDNAAFSQFLVLLFVGWFLTFSTQGSGGTNGALDHFNATGQQYPLVVKLGTITSDISTADCYSYAPDEDGPVKIPNLVDLLSKRGIKVASMYVSAKFCFLLHYR